MNKRPKHFKVYEYILQNNNGTKSVAEFAKHFKMKPETIYACMQLLRIKGAKLNIKRREEVVSVKDLIRKYATLPK